MARTLVWGEHYRMGIDQLDQEHQALFEHYNWLIESLENPDSNPTETIAITVAVLEEHASSHFEHEEALMIDCHYPHFVPHKIDHEAFMIELHQMKNRLIAGEDVLNDLCRFIKNWLSTHIVIRDMGIVAHLRGQSGSSS